MEEVWKQFLLARDRWLGTKGWEEAHHQGLLWTTTNTFLFSEQTSWLFENYLFHQELVCWRWRKSGNERHQCGNLTHWHSANIATLDKKSSPSQKNENEDSFPFLNIQRGPGALLERYSCAKAEAAMELILDILLQNSNSRRSCGAGGTINLSKFIFESYQ